MSKLLLTILFFFLVIIPTTSAVVVTPDMTYQVGNVFFNTGTNMNFTQVSNSSGTMTFNYTTFRITSPNIGRATIYFLAGDVDVKSGQPVLIFSFLQSGRTNYFNISGFIPNKGYNVTLTTNLTQWYLVSSCKADANGTISWNSNYVGNIVYYVLAAENIHGNQKPDIDWTMTIWAFLGVVACFVAVIAISRRW